MVVFWVKEFRFRTYSMIWGFHHGLREKSTSDAAALITIDLIIDLIIDLNYY